VLVSLKQRDQSVHGYLFDGYIDGAAQRLAHTIEKYDHIISTVGSFMSGGFLESTYDSILCAIAEKFNANLAIVQAFATHIEVGGSIIFTAGSGGKLYNASGAIIGNQNIKSLAQGLAIELAPLIRVNVVSPTWTETPLWHFMNSMQLEELKKNLIDRIPLNRISTIGEVASTYIFLMKNDFITGQEIVVDGGVSLL
jgi:NAD(P)-dependent dehydrogenase (short-subunit alcohol dehydrogenase family)